MRSRLPGPSSESALFVVHSRLLNPLVDRFLNSTRELPCSPSSLFLLTSGVDEQIYEMHTRLPFCIAGDDSLVFVFVL